MPTDISFALQKGLTFLAQQQEADGSFQSYTSTLPSFRNSKPTNSIFPTCLILASLKNLPAKNLKDKAAQFLLQQKSAHWTFNYWKRDSTENTTHPYPDDLDDTFCALSALSTYNPALIDGTLLSQIVVLLTHLEQNEGGPYRTWIVLPESADGWKDIDLAVNSNVAYFLSLQGVQLPTINRLVENALKKNQLTSPYYASSLSVIYFISRYYTGKQKPAFIAALLALQKNHHWGNPLDTALAVIALLQLGYAPKKLAQSLAYLLAHQTSNGSWKAYPFVIEKIKKKRPFFSGSNALTSAFCLEALQLFNRMSTPLTLSPKKNTSAKFKPPTLTAIKKKLNQRISQLPPKLAQHFQKKLTQLLKKDSQQQISLLPYFFAQSLSICPEKISPSLLIDLGAANCYGWLAYDIYDDALDGDIQTIDLPVANLCLREMILLFTQTLPDQPDFQLLVKKTLDTIEIANFEEVFSYRRQITNSTLSLTHLPIYRHYHLLANKSLGHMLGSLAILLSQGINTRSKEMSLLIKYFRHYLIARQLHDDAHDWEEDLKHGRLTPVVLAVMKAYKKQTRHIQINLKTDIPLLQQIFWHTVVGSICQDILDSISVAKQSLSKMNYVKKDSFLMKTLLQLELSARATLQEQKEVLDFLNHYQTVSE